MHINKKIKELQDTIKLLQQYENKPTKLLTQFKSQQIKTLKTTLETSITSIEQDIKNAGINVVRIAHRSAHPYAGCRREPFEGAGRDPSAMPRTTLRQRSSSAPQRSQCGSRDRPRPHYKPSAPPGAQRVRRTATGAGRLSDIL